MGRRNDYSWRRQFDPVEHPRTVKAREAKKDPPKSKLEPKPEPKKDEGDVEEELTGKK